MLTGEKARLDQPTLVPGRPQRGVPSVDRPLVGTDRDLRRQAGLPLVGGIERLPLDPVSLAAIPFPRK
jgi:hypothetical protein